MDVTVTFKGFKTLAEAEAFANWYSGSGQQDAAEWMEIQGSLTSCQTECITICNSPTLGEWVEVDLKIN